jgi:hypothetical protein
VPHGRAGCLVHRSRLTHHHPLLAVRLFWTDRMSAWSIYYGRTNPESLLGDSDDAIPPAQSPWASPPSPYLCLNVGAPSWHLRLCVMRCQGGNCPLPHTLPGRWPVWPAGPSCPSRILMIPSPIPYPYSPGSDASSRQEGLKLNVDSRVEPQSRGPRPRHPPDVSNQVSRGRAASRRHLIEA